MKLIDKAAVVAEIKKRIVFNNINHCYARKDECNAILYFIDTIEVKEVNLEKEMSKYLGDDWNKYAEGKIESEMIAFAKHFFELGLKAQKGE